MARVMLLVLGILAALSSSSMFLETSALDINYYFQPASFCPLATTIVSTTVSNYVRANKNKAAQLLRMHFHDCFVRGCEASVLINNTDGTTELYGPPNFNSLGGFEVIADIKAQLEQLCPRTVSCADIVALAARDGVFWLSGITWNVYLGRKDGNISNANETIVNLPAPFFNVAQLIASFAAKNLTIQQMVILSGAHTIGTANCGIDQTRLYNFTGRGDTDPTLDPGFANYLKGECPSGIQGKRVAMKDFLDPFINLISSNNTFDNNYYLNVNENKGFFQSDAALLQSNLTKSFVLKYMNNYLGFIQDFGNAMIAMGQVGVLETGYVRKICSVAFS